MDYDSEQKERAKQNAINSCDKLHLLIEINCIGRQIFIFLSIIHVIISGFSVKTLNMRGKIKNDKIALSNASYPNSRPYYSYSHASMGRRKLH